MSYLVYRKENCKRLVEKVEKRLEEINLKYIKSQIIKKSVIYKFI